MIDFNFHTDNKLQSGSILLSEPFLNDDYFSRSVILLCDHSEEGSFGFVLNKFVDTKISDFVEGFPAVTTNISIGGPVDTANLFYIHSLGSQIKNCVPA
ncbi:MAG: YqgE/AlgH family protein, partial [Flavobacteriales bacterium]